MTSLVKNARIYEDGKFVAGDFSLDKFLGDGVANCTVYDSVYVLPGLVDVHVHFREPGFSYKETILMGARAAARGGYAAVCTMPNLSPVPSDMDALRAQLDIIKTDACIRVIPYGSITRGEMGAELSDMDQMAPYVAGFSDDGKGVQSRDMMRAAMIKARKLDKIICAHCEDNSLLNGGYIHDGEYARMHGHRGISSESEWRQLARDIELVRETGCKYHACHISTYQSVDIIRRAKAEGLDVTCETGPHYLVFTDMDLQEDGRFKMNPPIRSARDRDALVEGIADGTIDMIATDHAPHSASEKARGLENSAMGVVGLETAFAAMYTYVVKKGVISLERLIELMHVNPARRFGIELDKTKNFTLYDLDAEYTVNPDEFLSLGRATPFKGMRVSGKCLMTVAGGKVAWREDEAKN